MKNGLLSWLDQALEVAESRPLVETSDAAVSTTALNDAAAEAGDSKSGDQALPAEATEQVAADGPSTAHGTVVMDVLASVTAAAEARIRARVMGFAVLRIGKGGSVLPPRWAPGQRINA